VRLQIVPPLTQSFEALDQGEIDIAIGGFADSPERFGHKRLIEDSFSCIVRRGHVLADSPLDIISYAQASHLLISTHGHMRGFVDDILAERGLTRHVALVVNHFAAAPPIVAESDLVLTAPTLVLKRLLTDDLVLLPAPVTAPLENRCLDLIWHRRLARHPAHEWLTNVIERAVHAVNGH